MRWICCWDNYVTCRLGPREHPRKPPWFAQLIHMDDVSETTLVMPSLSVGWQSQVSNPLCCSHVWRTDLSLMFETASIGASWTIPVTGKPFGAPDKSRITPPNSV